MITMRLHDYFPREQVVLVTTQSTTGIPIVQRHPSRHIIVDCWYGGGGEGVDREEARVNIGVVGGIEIFVVMDVFRKGLWLCKIKCLEVNLEMYDSI